MSLTPTAKKLFRQEVVVFTTLAEKNESRWSYSQRRPYSGLGVAPQSWHDDDCSAYCALTFWAAGHNSGHPVADCLGMHYSGWGWTQSAFDYLRPHPAPFDKYRIGDIAIYGTPADTVHMVVCRKAGTADTAIWSSHGSEAGPRAVKLHYHPSPVVGVFRHPALL